MRTSARTVQPGKHLRYHERPWKAGALFDSLISMPDFLEVLTALLTSPIPMLIRDWNSLVPGDRFQLKAARRSFSICVKAE